MIFCGVYAQEFNYVTTEAFVLCFCSMLMKFLFQYHRIAKHCALQEIGRPYAPHGGGDEDAEAALVRHNGG